MLMQKNNIQIDKHKQENIKDIGLTHRPYKQTYVHKTCLIKQIDKYIQKIYAFRSVFLNPTMQHK